VLKPTRHHAVSLSERAVAERDLRASLWRHLRWVACDCYAWSRTCALATVCSVRWSTDRRTDRQTDCMLTTTGSRRRSMHTARHRMTAHPSQRRQRPKSKDILALRTLHLLSWLRCVGRVRKPGLNLADLRITRRQLHLAGHGPMASAVARAYNGGLRADLQRGPGKESLVKGLRGEAPLKLKHFGFWTFSGSRKFAHFSTVWKRKEIKHVCYLCKKSQVATKLGA